MGWEHEPATVWKAQELYCVERQSFDKVAKHTGVAISTLKRWSEQHDWRIKRAELAQAEAEIRVDRVLARSRLLKKLLESGDARDAQAVSALERMTLKLAEAERTRRPPKSRRLEPASTVPPGVLSPEPHEGDIPPAPTTDAERVARLEDALNRRLSELLVCPDEDMLGMVKDFAAALRLAQSLRPGNAAAGATVSWEESGHPHTEQN